MNEEKENQELSRLNTYIERLTVQLERANYAEYVQLLNRPRRLLMLNFFSGIARGVGTGFGFTVVLGIILLIMQKMVNLPVIGKFLADIVRIVQAQLHTPTIP
ncbi:DUF5665 domain-containing protein [Effusibacillus dendaii]|uniref:Uncharacterized protein n=1 Tax=Effusibacillus dendaii TaxID=2743772 RepID=A0A7I8DDT4_9BACL|nr:DUF5665 domain-containing protein [Effusibacillus dendaii]BCJ86051.1 hypothetical protein skT53_10360 [Effusibacillus dendaii]